MGRPNMFWPTLKDNMFRPNLFMNYDPLPNPPFMTNIKQLPTQRWYPWSPTNYQQSPLPFLLHTDRWYCSYPYYSIIHLLEPEIEAVIYFIHI